MALTAYRVRPKRTRVGSTIVCRLAASAAVVLLCALVVASSAAAATTRSYSAAYGYDRVAHNASPAQGVALLKVAEAQVRIEAAPRSRHAQFVGFLAAKAGPAGSTLFVLVRRVRLRSGPRTTSAKRCRSGSRVVADPRTV